MSGDNETASRKHKRYTPWHVYFADVLNDLIEPEDMEVHPFDKLGSLPLESYFNVSEKQSSH